MLELGWAALIGLSLLDARTRPLGFLLAAKWAVNYLSFILIAEWSPAVVDVAAGAIGILLLEKHRGWWADVLIVGFITTCLTHAWFWMLWEAGMANGLVPTQYYLSVIGIFSVMLMALAWPGGRSVVVRVLDELDRRRVAHGVSHGRSVDIGKRAADRGRRGKGD